MNKLDLKIALRTFLKSKWYNILNIAGLAMGLAGFIFVTLYVDHETGYDRWNKNAGRIFLVEREMTTGPTPYTPGPLAAAIKSQCPEVEETGRTNTALFQIPFYTSSGRFLITKWMGADYSVAKILGIKPKGFNLNPNSAAPSVLLAKNTANVLFPGGAPVQNKMVNMMSRSGIPMLITGIAEEPPGNTNLNFDCIGFAKDITQGKDQSYASQIYETYLLVKPNTDVQQLSKKIDAIYKKAASADTSRVNREAISSSGAPAIFLDPLTNLHLKPHYGSQVSDQIVNGLIVIGIIILLVTGVNFTNLYISQANTRAKEVGIKKVNGINEKRIAVQFVLEIFIQCLIALSFSFAIVTIGLPYFNRLLNVDLLISGINLRIVIQLLVTLISLTLIAGIYPALVMAGFKPAVVLRGNQLSNGGRLSWVRNSLTVFQFTFAIVFIIILVVIDQQVTFMKTESTGFKAKQVVYIDNQTLFNNPAKFEPVHDRIRALPGVKNVTVASNIPGGLIPASNDYTIQNKALAMNTISVGYGYFETLNIGFKEGHGFSSRPQGDSTNAVINEAAVKALGLANPIGTMVKGCGGRYKIIGVAGNVKANGFEENVKPTIYLMSDHCGLAKTQILINAEEYAIPAILKSLNHDWRNINKLDGDNFNYHFLDELYGKLFVKQEQLQMVLTCFSVLALFIASLGFFASAACAIRLRLKEIAVRKVFGAGQQQLMMVLSKPFFLMIILANIIAWPVSFIIADRWLQTFAFRIHISVVPFTIALFISIAVVIATVCLQSIRAVRFNPVDKLKI